MEPQHAQIIMKLIDITGALIAKQLTKPDYDAQAKIWENFYRRLKEIDERRERERKGLPEIPRKEVKEETKGTACLPCSRDHLSTVSASLNEAVRFARKEGINHPEVLRRIGIALDELNIMERIDLAPENLTKLSEEERKIAKWALIEARELRHMITDIESVEDLEKVAAKASEVRTKFLEQLWSLTKKLKPEEVIKKICTGLKGEEKEKCERAIKELLEKGEGKIKEILKKVE